MSKPRFAKRPNLAHWYCLKNCGACCYLAPEERPYLAEFLPPKLLQEYLALVAEDGWCKNFDKVTRLCRIYEERPYFCRVSPEVLQTLYKEDPADLDDWAIHCCTEHISQSVDFNHLFDPDQDYSWSQVDLLLNPAPAQP